MEINREIKQLLKEHNENVNEALTILLVIYYKLEKGNLIMNDRYITTLSNLGIIGYDFAKSEYVFKMPLFVEEEDLPKEQINHILSEEFVLEYIDKFKAVNPTRRASKLSVRDRFEKLLKNFHDVTEDEIMKAVDMHIAELSSPNYLKQADYFIWKQNEGFNIMRYIEEIRKGPQKQQGAFDIL